MRALAISALVATWACSTAHSLPPTPRGDPGAAGPLRFVENDYPAALSEARASGRPLFVDVWVPW